LCRRPANVMGDFDGDEASGKMERHMKKKLVFMAPVLLAFAFWCWISHEGAPGAGNAREPASPSRAQERAVLQPPGFAGRSWPFPSSLPVCTDDRPDPGIPEAYDLNDPHERERFLFTMIETGIPDGEIYAILHDPAETAALNPTEPSAYDLGDPCEREQLLASLDEAGIPESEIPDGVNDTVDAADLNHTEPMPYDLSDPREREQFLSTMKAAGMPEKEAHDILNDRGDAPGLI
jgi:hypothetical protein